MFRIGEVVYDKSLKKEVVITPELHNSIKTMPMGVVESRWQSASIEDAVIVEKKEVKEVKEVEETKEPELTIEEAREAYEEKHGKSVANRYKNNLEWIMNNI